MRATAGEKRSYGGCGGSAFTLAQQSRRVHAAGSCKALDARMLNYHRMRCCGADIVIQRCTMADAAMPMPAAPRHPLHIINDVEIDSGLAFTNAVRATSAAGWLWLTDGVQWCAGTTHDV
jgi:hypothetical protein